MRRSAPTRIWCRSLGSIPLFRRQVDSTFVEDWEGTAGEVGAAADGPP